MLSVSSFFELCQHSDVRVLFGTEVYQFTVGRLTKKVSKEYQPDMSDIRYPIVTDLSGRKLGVCTDHNYTRYFGQTFCMYLPYTVEEYTYYLSLVAKLYGWFMPDSAIHPGYPVTMKPAYAILPDPSGYTDRMSRPYTSAVSTRDAIFKPSPRLGKSIVGTIPLIWYHRTHGTLGEGAWDLPHALEFFDACMSRALCTASSDSRFFRTKVPSLFSAEVNSLVHKTPVFEVFHHWDTPDNLNVEVIHRLGLTPLPAERQRKVVNGKFVSSLKGTFFIIDPNKVTPRHRSLMKLHGFRTYTASGLKSYLPSVTWDDRLTSHTAWFKTLLEFHTKHIGVDDMHLSDPVFYAGHVAHVCTGSPKAHGRRWKYVPFRGNKNFRHNVKNKKIRDALEKSLIQNKS